MGLKATSTQATALLRPSCPHQDLVNDTVVSLIAGMRGDEPAAEQAAAEAERVAASAGANITVAFAQFGRVVAAEQIGGACA